MVLKIIGKAKIITNPKIDNFKSGSRTTTCLEMEYNSGFKKQILSYSWDIIGNKLASETQKGDIIYITDSEVGFFDNKEHIKILNFERI